MATNVFASNAAPTITRPLAKCPACDSERLDPIVERETLEVHFLCKNCDRCWKTQLGFVQRVAPTSCLGCPEHERCERTYAADNDS